MSDMKRTSSAPDGGTESLIECAHPYCSQPADNDDYPYCIPHRLGVSREFDVPTPDDDGEKSAE